jgi:carbon monoxide dehydrogenase subunit G
MNLSGTYAVFAPSDKVYAALTDPVVLQRLIDGCEKMVPTGHDSYDAHLKIGFAGMKSHAVVKIQLKDRQPPESFALLIEGRAVPGFVKGTAHIQLSGKDGRTEIQCDADAQVGGLIAAVGSRLIEAAARRMLDEFFRKFGEQIIAASGSACTDALGAG